jgi:FkbM family methyltransferase
MVGPNGGVISCEASPSVFQKLTLSTAYYPWVKAFNYGVGATKGELEFYEQGLSSSGSFSHQVTAINAQRNLDLPIIKVPVQLWPIDSLAAEYAIEPSVVKVDVEGYELEVLRGGINTLIRRVATWIVEVHPPQLRMFGGTEDELMALFSSYHYYVSVIDRNPNSLYTFVAEPNHFGI